VNFTKRLLIDRRRDHWLTTLAIIVVGAISVRIGVWLWTDPPLLAMYGNSPFYPRLAALVGVPTSVWLIAWAAWRGTVRSPLVSVDNDMLVSKTWPFHVQKARWEEVKRARLSRSEKHLLFVELKNGTKFKIDTSVLERGWDPQRLAEEMRRWSGGRVPELQPR